MAGATVISQAGSATPAASMATAPPNENPANTSGKPGQRSRAKATAANASCLSPTPSSCVPSLVPTPRKLKRNARRASGAQGPRHGVRHLVVHVAPEERMRMADDGSQ